MMHDEEMSPTVREVLARIPRWYESWGTSLIAMVVFSLLLMSWLIRYPDAVPAKVTITTTVPPLTLHSRTSGLLTHLKPENTSVQAGDYLAVIANPGSVEEMEQVKQQVRTVQEQLTNPLELARYQPAIYHHLGDVQAEFSVFIQRLTSYQYLLRAPHFQQKAENVSRRREVLDALNAKLMRQQQLLRDEMNLYEKKYRRDSTLVADKVTAPADFEQTQIEYLHKRNLLENLLIQLDQNRLQKAQLDEMLITSSEQYSGNQQSADVLLQESMQKLQSRIDWWEQTYVLKAPIAGRLAYLKSWTNGQYVAEKDPVLSVVPQSDEVVGHAELPLGGSGKVRIGQTVRIKLDNYPYYQFGALTGQVTAMSMVPSGDNYLLTIKFPRGLRTNYNQSIVFRQQMRGVAQIITDDFSLLERIFFQLRYPFAERL